MHKYIALVFSLFILHYPLQAQIFPREGSNLNYRIIGFSFPRAEEAVKYKIEIAAGNYNSLDSFRNNIILKLYTEKNKMIAEVPSFGIQYTWRVKYIGKDSSKIKSPLHHFSIKNAPDLDETVTRLRITKSAEKYKDAYVFLDETRALYDMTGKPVWFLPGIGGAPLSTPARDIKITPQGTITFITGYQPYEVNYDGQILWRYTRNKAQQDIDTFHHDFTRLNNGHYMGLVFENEWSKLPAFKDILPVNAQDSARFYTAIKLSSIVEYDKNNNIVWRWNCNDYLKISDLSDLKTANGAFNPTHLHPNAFFFDEKNKAIYLSFRNINRIVKIKYPEGNVINTYGTIHTPEVANLGNNMFCGQHSCRVSKDGYLYLFNNNLCSHTHIPTILILQEPIAGENDLKKIWEYQCTINDPGAVSENHDFYSGGNVQELPSGEMFATISKPYPKVFIVNKDKKVLWNAIPEKYDAVAKKWKLADEL